MDNLIAQIFSDQVGQHTTILLFVMAFLGGVISSASPCSLGLLPVVIGYVGGQNQKKGAKLMIQVLSFILGISLCLTIIGVTCAMTGQVLGAQAQPLWVLLLASIIMIMGLHMMEVIHVPMPTLIKELPQNKNSNMFFIPVLIGAAFAIGTTPCSTPILASIMAFASMKSNIASAALLFFVFSLGQGLILLVAAFCTNVCKKMLRMHAVSSYMMKVSGFLLVGASGYIYYKMFSQMI